MDIEQLTHYDEEHPKKKKRKRKWSRKKKIIVFSIITLLFIIVSGLLVYLFIIKKEPNKVDNEKKKQEVEEVKKLTIVDEDSNERPIAIMIDNNVGNDKHIGLQDSYINYEIIVEGGLTRIMAVFKDRQIDTIGPVRSSRHYFLDYALESNAIYTHYGWSTFAENDIKSLGVNNINGLYDSTPFWRDKTIAAPHNVFTSIDKIYDYAKNIKGYSTETNSWKVLNYTTDTINLNKPIETKTVINEETGKKEKQEVLNPELITANTVAIPYSNYQERGYNYDAENGYYLRTMNGVAHTDKKTGLQLHYKNIIIMKVANYSLDSYGRQDLNTVGTGEGYYVTNGYALPIKWEKTSRSGKTKYTYSDGKEIKINDGNTFIQVQPQNLNTTIN